MGKRTPDGILIPDRFTNFSVRQWPARVGRLVIWTTCAFWAAVAIAVFIVLIGYRAQVDEFAQAFILGQGTLRPSLSKFERELLALWPPALMCWPLLACLITGPMARIEEDIAAAATTLHSGVPRVARPNGKAPSALDRWIGKFVPTPVSLTRRCLRGRAHAYGLISYGEPSLGAFAHCYMAEIEVNGRATLVRVLSLSPLEDWQSGLVQEVYHVEGCPVALAANLRARMLRL